MGKYPYGERRIEVLNCVSCSHNGITVQEIAEELGINRITAAVYLARYKKQGLLLRHKEKRTNGQGPAEYVYQVSKNGNERLERLTEMLRRSYERRTASV